MGKGLQPPGRIEKAVGKGVPTMAGIIRGEKAITGSGGMSRSDYETMDTESPARSTRGKVKR
jgi:hypothetical protein